MRYFKLYPEVPGGLGDGTILDTSSSPPAVHDLDFVFDGWLGDDLVTSFPCFLVTDRLGAALLKAGLTGFHLRECRHRKSANLIERRPTLWLPKFMWLTVDGLVHRDDLAVVPPFELLASCRAMAVLHSFNIKHCDISAWE